MKNLNRYLRFSIIYILAFVAVVVVSVLLKTMLNSNGASSSVVVLPLVTGMMLGQWYFETSEEAPTSKVRWSDAIRFGLLGLLINFVLGLVILILSGGVHMLSVIGPVGWVFMLLFMALLAILSTRMGIWLGIRTTLNARAVKGAK